MRAALLFFLVQIPAASIAAQVPIPAGAKVKIGTHAKASVVGTLLSQSGDSIVITTAGSKRSAVASNVVTRIEVSQGRSHKHGAFRGMKIGSLSLGGGLALAVAAAYLSDDVQNGIVPLYMTAFYGAAVGAVCGVVIGGILGTERWSTLYSAPMRVTFGPVQRGTPGVGLSIRF
jgi:hypothetical protein